MSETNTPTSTSILHQEMRRLEIKKYGELILFLKEQNLGLSETALKILENEEATLKIKNDEPEAWRQRATLNEEKVDELKARNANLEVENSDLKNKVVKLEQEHKVRTVGEQSQVKTRSAANTKTCEASERQKKNVSGEIQSKRKKKQTLESSAQDSTSNHRMISENSGRIVETVTKSHDQIEPKVDTGNSDNTTESCMEDMIPDSAQKLSELFDKAIKTGQKQILYWFYYSLEFENRFRSLTMDGKVKYKTARSKIYRVMKPFLPMITDVNLRKRTERARKILKLFGEGAYYKSVDFENRDILSYYDDAFMKRFDDDSGDETFERGCRNSIQPEASEFSDEGSQNETSAGSSSSDSDSDESIDSNHQIHYESSNEESQNENSVSSPNSDTDYDESDAKREEVTPRITDEDILAGF
ncbi:hypothetical protein GLOIN_2v1780500 [Rhizophagus irregularis DAOM 181602=DAOM 197198]|uniref:Uncharacterized protein n=1 Tax=Rhizophagus irregularis (strain DAOM 181602 / DAOM 197198 / MUCL 43194) TaxID=747089 RepID=A0A2P4PM55_RHIID|nr:hypothetical protein GLOIN_2v1780500 [Rhizophagus irregularis DAOM 181602=DAOM 197198]POG66459.1 hypothetical protein GLOIN_2v1780500 [Rhizophagus irregularis DAOM 181602=DAOM 197198]|eukprot:XP_025173325.1 hypothetical protein GLOIN_2v1780500 [Rhizophagus irregularis DAOM 181602=DAOM 197198]